MILRRPLSRASFGVTLGHVEGAVKSKIINQKFAILNRKCLKFSVWRSVFGVSGLLFGRASVVPPFLFSFSVIPTTVGRRPALPAGGNPLLLTARLPFYCRGRPVLRSSLSRASFGMTLGLRQRYFVSPGKPLNI